MERRFKMILKSAQSSLLVEKTLLVHHGIILLQETNTLL